jgi:hypothetical protein
VVLPKLVVDAAHGGGDPTLEPNSTIGAVATGAGATPEIVPDVDMTMATGATMTGDSDGDGEELDIVMEHLRL